MAEEVVRVLRVDTGNSAKSINDIRKEIKSLRSELEKAAVGSEEFESALRELTQAQRSYNEVQQQVRDMSRTNQQEMVKFARFAQNLGKSYSALNAAIGLFADGNEDVQKAMLKVQRTIQLIQGLEGITGLIRDIPKIAASFKNWFNALDPVEKQVDRIASGINGISPQKLQAINEANRTVGGAGRVTTATATVGQVAPQPVIAAQNEGLSKQNTLIAAQAQEAEKLNSEYNKLSEATAEYADLNEKLLEAENGDYDTKKKIIDQMDEQERKIQTLLKNSGDYASQLKLLNDRLNTLKAELKGYDDLKIKDPYSEGLRRQIELLEKQRKSLIQSQSVWTRLGVTIKGVMASIVSTVTIMAAVAAVIALVKAIGDYVKKVTEAAAAQQKLNREINELANKNGAKAVTVLKELSYAYARAGDTAEAKQKFLKQYADKIRETGLAIDTVKEAEDVFVNNTQKYVQAIMARAKAQAIEQKAIEIYQKYLDDRNKIENPDLKWWQKGLVAMAVPEGRESVAADFIEKNRKEGVAKLDQMEKDVEERLRKMFEDVADLEKEYMPIFTSLESVTVPKDTTNWAEEYDKALKALEKYAKDRLDILKDERTKELDAARDNYNDLVNQIQEAYKQGTKAAKGNAADELEIWNTTINALKLARETYEREKLDIIKKYNDKAFADEKAASDKSIQLVQTSIERLRKMSDTSNLRGPSQQNVQTEYTNPFKAAKGITGSDIWKALTPGTPLIAYQSGEDIKAQYDQQVKYNNDLYNLTQERINGENKMLEEQKNLLTQRIQLLQGAYENTDINDLDGRKAILEEMGNAEFELWSTKQTIAENEIALNDALNENYEANTEAFVSMQEKRQQALNGTLSVASNLFGAMAQMAKTESQNQNKTEKEREDSLKAYKAFAVTQAIINTFQGANEAYTSMASIPYVGPALGIAAAVAAVAMGIANVHSILSESTNTSSATSAAQTAPPTPMQTPPIEYTRQLIGDKELDEVNKPIKCYVLQQDIDEVSHKVHVTEQNASF